MSIRLLRLSLMACTMITCMSSASIALAQSNPKPMKTSGDCAAPEIYSLVADGDIGPWQAVNPLLADSAGYDPAAAQTICGLAVNSQRLKCVDQTGVVAASPGSCMGQAILDYDASNSGRTARVSYGSPVSYYSVAQRDLGSCQTSIVRGVWKSTPGTTPSGCGMVTVPMRVECVAYETGALLAESACGSERPPLTTMVEDKTACVEAEPPKPPAEPTVSEPAQVPVATQIQLGTCNYTSSGGGRYACGAYQDYRPGPRAPSPRDLCTGSFMAGSDGQGIYDDSKQTPNAGVNWSVQPVMDVSIRAQCVVHWKAGYSDNGRTASWYSAYYSGPPSGVAGGMFIGKKP